MRRRTVSVEIRDRLTKIIDDVIVIGDDIIKVSEYNRSGFRSVTLKKMNRLRLRLKRLRDKERKLVTYLIRYGVG